MAIEAGHVVLSDRPGVGISLADEVVERYAL